MTNEELLMRLGRDLSIRSASVAGLTADNARYQKALEDIANGMGETDLVEIGRYAPVVARAALNTERTDK